MDPGVGQGVPPVLVLDRACPYSVGVGQGIHLVLRVGDGVLGVEQGWCWIEHPPGVGVGQGIFLLLVLDRVFR